MSRPPFAVSLVILDVDGTLVDFVGALRTGLEAVAEEVSARAGGVKVETGWLQTLRNEVARDLVAQADAHGGPPRVVPAHPRGLRGERAGGGR